MGQIIFATKYCKHVFPHRVSSLHAGRKKIKIATPASTPHWLYLTTPSGRSIMVDDTVFIRVL